MVMPAKLEQSIPQPMPNKESVKRPFARVVCDPKQYNEDIQSVLNGTVARPVSKVARLGMDHV